jgi:subtilisin-like proprotein convertase family protein
MPGTITKLVVRLSALTHTFPDDIDVLLIGPQGQSVLLMADAGGSVNVVNVTLTFDQSAAAPITDGGEITSGSYLPSNFAPGEAFDPPAPDPPFNTTLEVFNLTNPNGTWSLYVYDDRVADFGSFDGGWTLTITSVA